MTEVQEDLKYAEKIAKLLRQAEGAGTQAEADAFTEKAQQLLVTYAISEELLAQAQGLDVVQDTVVEETITYTGIYRQALFDIGRAIARANGCKVLIINGNGFKPAYVKLCVVGFSKDVGRVKLLDASIQLQAGIAQRRWWEEYSFAKPSTDHLSGMAKFKMRREFLFGFARGLAVKLQAAAQAGVSEGEKMAGARVGSGELVLRDRAVRVQEWYDVTYGKTTRKVRRSYSYGGSDARNAGHAAGRTANVGQPSVGGGPRGAIES